MRRNGTLITILIFLLSLVWGCSSQPDPLLKGKWREIGKTEVVEFYGDGTMAVADMGVTTTGVYTTEGKGRVKIDLKGSSAPIVYTVTVTADEAVFSDPKGIVLRYQKIP